MSVVRVITNFKVEAALAKNSLTNNIFRIPGIVRSCLSKFDDDRSIQTIAKKTLLKCVYKRSESGKVYSIFKCRMK